MPVHTASEVQPVWKGLAITDPEFEPIFGHKGINNLLEFIGMAINIWLACLESEGGEHCILAIGDNTSAIGWLHYSSRLDTRGDDQSAHLLVARKIATLLINFRCCLASQHLKGDLNIVADLLSFAGEALRGKRHPIAADMPANDELTIDFLPRTHHRYRRTCHLPTAGRDAILTTQVLRIAESSLTQGKRAATNPSTGRGEGGKVTAITSGTMLTPASLCYPTTKGVSSSGPSSTSTDKQLGTQGQTYGQSSRTSGRKYSAQTTSNLATAFRINFGSSPCTSRISELATLRPPG
ncbi:hypothetical protein MHU86_16883 [Fragilaria crotonensis]|nr:hypothetical protein MHU86_16883 [Fragilaria crotonensis]